MVQDGSRRSLCPEVDGCLKPGDGYKGIEDGMMFWSGGVSLPQRCCLVCSFLFYVKFHSPDHLLIGILAIFAWRIFAKSALHLTLPPTFRFLARFFRLPKRRFYTPATEYKSVPSDFHSDGSGGFYLQPIPSMIDLPTSIKVGVEVGGIGSGVKGVQGNGKRIGMGENGMLKRSGAIPSGPMGGSFVTSSERHNKIVRDNESRGKEGLGEHVKHYDADGNFIYLFIFLDGSDCLPFL